MNFIGIGSFQYSLVLYMYNVVYVQYVHVLVTGVTQAWGRWGELVNLKTRLGELCHRFLPYISPEWRQANQTPAHLEAC
jgi:hypothetical protein